MSITAENAVSHRYVVANGNKTLTAFSDSSGYSQERLIQILFIQQLSSRFTQLLIRSAQLFPQIAISTSVRSF